MNTNNTSERRQSERIPTEIQGNIENDNCLISNLSDGGLLVLSTFIGEIGQEVTIQFTYNHKFFEKKGIIREINSFNRLRNVSYKKNFLYGISISFIEPVTKSDFVFLDG